jgi:DNA-binding CsgD family transcriptional regulator
MGAISCIAVLSGEHVAGDLALSKAATLDFLCLQGETYPEGTASTLAGRDEQLQALGGLLRACAFGNGIVAVIRGPVGSGKSTLLQAFLRQAAAAGAICLGAVGSRAERELPLGILDQLLRSGPLPEAISQQVADSIEVHMLTAAPPGPEPAAISPEAARVFESLLHVLVELSEGHPLVLAVDDLHYADISSLQCLSYLVRRATASRILAVLTECPQTLPADRPLHAEILRQGNCTCIPLGPLPLSVVAGLLGEHLDSEIAPRLASSCYAMTGGSPLLVNALGQDARASNDQPGTLVPRAAFRSAVVACLHRYESETVELAQAVAVLGESATPDLLAELLDISAESASHGIAALTASGLFKAGHFRHETARQAVLENMTAEERAAMHGRAAKTLYKTGAAPATLATHLVDGPEAGEPWTVPVLTEAAERAIADGDPGRAIVYLRRAECECVDDRQRAATRFALACAEWPVNPESAARRLADLVVEARAGRLDDECMARLAYYLLWLGDTDNAADMLSTTDIAQVDTKTGQVGLAAGYIQSPLSFLYPELAGRARNLAKDGKSSLGGHGRPRAPGASAPRSAIEPDVDATLVVAERVLQEHSLSEPTLASVTTALMALICDDRLDRAAFWCTVLMDEPGAAARGVLWRAVLTGFRAVIETRWGNLEVGERLARTALAMLSRKAWGVAIGVPLSSLLLTTIANGKLGEAAECLRIPVPEAMFGTPYGLLYLYGRGEYYLATGCPQAALADFTDCGNRMIMWGLDQPGLVPWRTKAAESYLAVGNNLKARELARKQLAQAGRRPSRTRGISLRVLASTSHPSKRTALLRESVEVLRDSGARLELAYAFNDLSNAHLALGEHGRAHWAARQARNLAERCGAQALKVALSKADIDVPESGDGVGARLLDQLSDAEQRVAMLAACGYTNNQIAHKLYITVSTVEQHLTRVYRKLGVTGRAELPIDI